MSGKGYYWNKNDGSNKWEESSLKEELNTNYWNSLGEYQKYIEKSKWYLGALVYTKRNTYTPNIFYKEERSNIQGYSKGATSYINNIGLMYPSDYGYSINKNYVDEIMFSHATEYQKMWLFTVLQNPSHEWTISPEKEEEQFSIGGGAIVWSANYLAHVYTNNAFYEILKFGVRPTFYLKGEVLYKKGEGTIDNPYYISL